jgi:PmbA protein
MPIVARLPNTWIKKLSNGITQQLDDIKTAVADVLALAKQKGATQAEASMSKVQGIAVSARMQEVETVEFTNDGGLGISLYVGKKKGSASTADLSHDALALAVSKAIEIAKYTEEDPCNGLADEALLATDIPDCDLYHPVALDTEAGLALALETERYALDSDPRITNSDGASYNANIGCRVYGNSHGFLAGYPSTRYSTSCVVIAEENGDMQRDYAYTVDRIADRLKSTEKIGKEAAKHALSRLGAEKVKTGKYPVMFDSQIAGSLFGHLVSAISGGSLYRKSSFLLDSVNTQILPEWMTITEQPHLPQALASSPFDHEGVATIDRTIVADGILQLYLMTTYSGRKMNLPSTGHAGGVHNWQINTTHPDQASLLKDMGTGVLVTELMGQGVNGVTGDYSRGAAGFWVENGVIQYPISEFTIASNLKDMLLNIVGVGGDIERRGSMFTGSVLLSEMQIAGE